MKISTALTLLISVLLTSTMCFGQKRQLVLAGKSMEQMNYVQAIDKYEKAAEKGHEFTQKELGYLADMHYSLGHFKESADFYGKLYQKDIRLASTAYKKYAHALFVLGNQIQANEVVNKARQEFPDQEILGFTSSAKSISNQGTSLLIKDTIPGYIIINEPRPGYRIGIDTQTLIDKVAIIDGSGKATSLFPKAKYHQGPSFISVSGDVLYLTASTHKGDKIEYANGSYAPLQIYQYAKQGDLWVNERKLPFSSDRYSTSSPSLSSDGKTMYFVSDQPGGYGQTDVYKSVLGADGLWGIAENLGPKINTPGKESHVFVNEQNLLFFSSDGHGGLSGLDVFAIDLNQPEGNIYRLDAPINSDYDDFGYFSRGLMGYVSSNRSSKLASYAFTMDKPMALQNNFKLNLSLADFGLAFNEPISIEIMDKEGALVWANEVMDSSLGQGRVESSELPKGSYQLSLKGAHIQTTELSFESNEASTLELEVALKGKYDNTSDIIQQWGYPMLTFDFDRHTTTLDRDMIQMLADRLSRAESIIIEGHSDQRGKAKYNQKLSQKRAEYIRDQLVEAGLSAESIKVIGLGERQLLVNCRSTICGVKEEQKNRRVEIKAQF